MIGPEAYLEYAEGVLPYESEPWARGRIEFLCLVARGLRDIDEDYRGPSAYYQNAYGADPEAPEWEELRAYRQRVDHASVDAIIGEYRGHFTDKPVDVLVRRFTVGDLGGCPDRWSSRSAIMELLLDEPDDSIRMMAAAQLFDLCDRGDEEAASFLESLAETEANIRHVRPMMQYVARYIREGDPEQPEDPASAP